MSMQSDTAFNAIGHRRAIRSFSQREVQDELLFQLLELSNRAPSGFNLQPWHFVVVRDSHLKKLLSYVAMGQKQVIEAPLTVVFVADPKAWKGSYKKLLQSSLDVGAIKAERADFNRKAVNLLFRTGPMGLVGLVKKIAVPLRRLKKPTPNVITSYQEAVSYVRSQTMLAAATFMIAAKSVGLDTSPMESFDEIRIKKLLSIPSYMSVPIIIATGYALEVEEVARSVRLPLEQKVSVNKFSNHIVAR